MSSVLLFHVPYLPPKNSEQPKGCLLKSICWSWFDIQQQLPHSFRKTEVLCLLWTCSPGYKHSCSELLSVVSVTVASSLWGVVGLYLTLHWVSILGCYIMNSIFSVSRKWKTFPLESNRMKQLFSFYYFCFLMPSIQVPLNSKRVTLVL